jgi:hypothetical protein
LRRRWKSSAAIYLYYDVMMKNIKVFLAPLFKYKNRNKKKTT